MLGKTVIVASLTVLVLSVCSRQDQEQVRAGQASERSPAVPSVTCDTTKYGSPRFLATLPFVRVETGREDLAMDPATRTQTLLLTTSHGKRIASTISWGGPNGGALVLLTCDGEVLRSAILGYVRSIRSLDLNGDGVPQLIIEQQTGSGTGWTERQTGVYGIAADTIAVLWSTVTFAGSYQGPELGGDWEVRAKVSFPAGGRIEVERDSMAVRYDSASGQWKPSSEPKRRHETYVFDRKLGIFVLGRAA